MTDEPLLDHARRLWAEMAGAPIAFRGAEVDVAISPRSLLCPPGWVGFVTLGDATIATAPDEASAAVVRLGDPPAADVLGPATLAYCDAERFRPSGTGAAERLPADHRDLKALIARVPAVDAGEAALDEITSPAFVVRAGSDVVAAAGYTVWPAGTAHLSVLTAVDHRGQGLARLVAGAAVSDALAAGLVPQWRARPEASRRVALALGFLEFGTQLSIRLHSTG